MAEYAAHLVRWVFSFSFSFSRAQTTGSFDLEKKNFHVTTGSVK